MASFRTKRIAFRIEQALSIALMLGLLALALLG